MPISFATDSTESSTGIGTWPLWNSIYSCTSTTASITDVWTPWNYQYSSTSATVTTTTSVSDHYVWLRWNQAGRFEYVPMDAGVQVAPVVRNEAEIAARRELVQKTEEAAKVAREKARELLLSVLDDKQRKELDTLRYFTVMSEKSKRIYRINTGMGVSRNIDEVNEKGVVIKRLCAHHSDYQIPDWDHFVSQKLMLEHAEEDFRKIANFS